MMDPDDLVIIENEFATNIEVELPQHPAAFLMDNTQTMGDLVPQMLPAAPNFNSEEVRDCHGCHARDRIAAHHEQSFHPKPPPCEAVRNESRENVEERRRPDITKTGLEPLIVHNYESLEPVMDHPGIQLPYRERTVGSESLEKPRRFSPPVRHNHLLRQEPTKHKKAASSASCTSAKQGND
jgi:hypothetical protein